MFDSFIGDVFGACMFAAIVTPPIVIWLDLWRDDDVKRDAVKSLGN